METIIPKAAMASPVLNFFTSFPTASTSPAKSLPKIFIFGFDIPVAIRAKKSFPPLIGLFISPGHRGATLPDNPWQADLRSYEYDSLSDEYVQFLIQVSRRFGGKRHAAGRNRGQAGGGDREANIHWFVSLTM